MVMSVCGINGLSRLSSSSCSLARVLQCGLAAESARSRLQGRGGIQPARVDAGGAAGGAASIRAAGQLICLKLRQFADRRIPREG